VTDPILGGHDALLEDIVAFVRGERGERWIPYLKPSIRNFKLQRS